jgi:hypothetical protein
MLEARIVSPKGTLYFAGEPTPYDLQTLRLHIREFARATREVRLEVSVDDMDWNGLEASGWIHQLAIAGARVCHVGPLSRGADAETAAGRRAAARTRDDRSQGVHA